MKKTSLFAAMAAVVLALACNSRILDDAGIAAKVKGKLAEDSQTSAIKIGVSRLMGSLL
jgi:hypothetical protein